jgi:glycosyltransferase involved in cell wall biosynthesis
MPSALFRMAHRHLWRRLPQKGRRRLLLKTSALVAPRISPDARAVAPVIIAGMLRSASGMGATARGCHDALQCDDLPVFGIDLTRTLGYETDVRDWTFVDGRHLIGRGTLFLHVSGPLVPLVLARLGRRFVRDKHVMAHWFWELQELPEEWRYGIPFVHGICVNTQFVARAVRPTAGTRPIHLVPHPMPMLALAPAAATENRPFTVLVVFNVASSLARKNPCAAIRAFRHAFGDDDRSVKLIVKFANADHWPPAEDQLREAAGNATNVELLGGGVFGGAAMADLFENADAVLSLHRAEGLGLVMIEGMLRGLPVVATDWSGNTDFLTPETGIPIGHDLVPAEDPQGTYDQPRSLWAEPRVEEAAAALRLLRSNPIVRKQLGKAAAKAAAHRFSTARYAESIRALLES